MTMSSDMELFGVVAIFLFLPFVGSTRVYEFFEGEPTTDVSFITFNASVPQDGRLAVCTTHRQIQSNLNTTTLYTIYEDKENSKLWLSVGFWDDALWGQESSGLWHLMGSVSRMTDFISWIHICIEFDLPKVLSSINGQTATSVTTSLKSTKTFYLR